MGAVVNQAQGVRVETKGRVPNPANLVHVTVEVLGAVAVEKEEEMEVRVRGGVLFPDGEVVNFAVAEGVTGRMDKAPHAVAEIGGTVVEGVVLREFKIEADEEVARAAELGVKEDVVDAVDDEVETGVAVGDEFR